MVQCVGWCLHCWQVNQQGQKGVPQDQELKVCTWEEIVGTQMYPTEMREMQYKIKLKSMYLYIPPVYTGKSLEKCVLFALIMYLFPRVCTMYIQVHADMYLRQTGTEPVHTRAKSMY